MADDRNASARIACVDVPALSLQLVIRAHPEWQGDPVVVVEDDRPLAKIVWANRAARAHKIRRGMSFAQAKALSARLHAEVVAEPAVMAGIDALFDLLVPYSPSIEPVLLQPGLFWLDPRGMQTLFGNLERWAARVHEKLCEQRFVASVVVGHERPRVFAIACVQSGPFVVQGDDQEQQLAARVPLDRLGISPALRDDLALLEVHSVGELLRLPVAQLRVRYGAEAARLHDFFSGKSWTPLLPRIPVPPLCLSLEVDPPDDDCARLLFGLKAVLDDAAARLAAEHQAITALELTMRLDAPDGVPRERCERIETAAPTLDVQQLVDLLRLRLATVDLPAPVEHIAVQVEAARVHARQVAMQLHHGRKPRDLSAAARAIARLRASLGPEAVTRARLCEAYLPEAAFCFEPTRELALPRPQSAPAGELPLVRRLLPSPVPLPPLPSHEPEAWLGRHGAVSSMFGPYRIASGWWGEGKHERDYHFVETRTGELLWIFYDRALRRWFVQGAVD
jgi:protein ImuB